MNKQNKNLLILLVIFVALALVAYFFFGSKEKTGTNLIKHDRLFDADSAKIDKIEIAKTSEDFVMEKIGSQWTITKPINYSADTNAIAPLLHDLTRFRIENIASVNKNNFNSYLDTANHTVVTVWQEGKELGSFEMGVYALSMMNSYLRRPNGDTVYLATNITSSDFNKSLKDFRYKIIFSIPSETISKLEFSSTDSNKVNFTCVKDSTGKWFIGTDSIPHNNVDGFMNLMKAFTTDDFADTVITNFPTPTYTCKVFGPTETTINMYKVNANPVYYIVQVSGIKQLFKFSEGYASNIYKKKKDFIPETEKKK